MQAINRTVYGSVISPFVRKVLVVLDMNNISFDLKGLTPFIDHHKEILLTLNPLGKIPVYQEDDFVIADSSVICAYLDRKYSVASIYPKESQDFAKSLWYEEYADTHLIPTIATVFFNTTLAKRFNITPDMDAVRMALENKLPTIFDYLNEQIGNKSYLAGDQLSIADISITSPFLNFAFAGQHVDAGRWVNLSRYIEAIKKEKSVATVFANAQAKWDEVQKSG